jgi:hypothetical protein
MSIFRLALVTPFHQIEFFQWYEALSKNENKLNISVHPVIICPSHLKKSFSDPYWNQLREADAILVYVTRVNPLDNWWELPKFVKQIMKPEAKMFVQWDDEFQWLWNAEYTFWGTNAKMANPKFTSPEQFFKDTNILEVPDIHLCVTENPLFKPFTSKPVIQLLLPQLLRYKPEKYTLVQGKPLNIAIMRHHATGSNFMKTIDNVIKPNNFPTSFFNWYNEKNGMEYCKELSLPVGSRAYGKLPFEAYEDILWKTCSIGIDDPIGYIGWSRFVMECAIAYVPCIGSTDAVKMLFPELYTAPQDYAKQIELIQKLRNEKDFYTKIAEIGRKRCMKELSTENLCTKLVKLFIDSGVKASWTLEGLFVDFLHNHFNTPIPLRPNSSTAKVFDQISKRIINQEQWDMLYGKWKPFLDNQELYNECRKKVMDRNT